MTDAELVCWAACKGWEVRRGGGMVELIRPDGRTYAVVLAADQMPVLDFWQRDEIARARGAAGPAGGDEAPTGEPERPE